MMLHCVITIEQVDLSCQHTLSSNHIHKKHTAMLHVDFKYIRVMLYTQYGICTYEVLPAMAQPN